jgi:hypothetical protein
MKTWCQYSIMISLVLAGLSGCSQNKNSTGPSDFFFQNTTIAPPSTGTLSSTEDLGSLPSAAPYYTPPVGTNSTTAAAPTDQPNTAASNWPSNPAPSGSSVGDSNSTWSVAGTGLDHSNHNSNTNGLIAIDPAAQTGNSASGGGWGSKNDFRPGSTNTDKALPKLLNSPPPAWANPGGSNSSSSSNPATMTPPPKSFYQSKTTGPPRSSTTAALDSTRIAPIDYADSRILASQPTRATEPNSYATDHREEVVQVIQPRPSKVKPSCQPTLAPQREPQNAIAATYQPTPAQNPKPASSWQEPTTAAAHPTFARTAFETSPATRAPTLAAKQSTDWITKQSTSSAPLVTRPSAPSATRPSAVIGSRFVPSRPFRKTAAKTPIVDIMDLPDPGSKSISGKKFDQSIRPVAFEQTSTPTGIRPVEEGIPASDSSQNWVQPATFTSPISKPIEPSEKQFSPASAPGTAADSNYAFDPDYRWLRGKLDYSAVLRRWKISYQKPHGETDSFGGSAVLDNIEKLGEYQRGDYVEVHGSFKQGADGNWGYAPEFHIESIKKIGPNEL